MHILQSRWSTGMCGRLLLAAAFGLIIALPQAVDARVFHCRAGDVACLIAAIKQANVQPGPRHEIRLEAGTYTLTAVENEIDGPNGLPSITGPLTIRGAGEEVTILERNIYSLPFRLLHVAPTGKLMLDGLILRGDERFLSILDILGGGGLFNAGGVVTILNSTFAGHGGMFGGGLFNAGGVVTILNSTFAGNGGHFGGGLYSSGGMTTILNSTIAGNYTLECCGGGGALFVTGVATVRSCLEIKCPFHALALRAALRCW